MSLETPIYNLKNFSNVYQPSEDTFLLLDALEFDFKTIVDKNPTFIVEIGSGSGVIITALASHLKNSHCFATDINFEACLATNCTSKLNNTHIELCNMNFLSFFKKCLFDLIIFNPPYVVTDSTEIVGTGIARAWAGGIDGRQIIDKFLNQLPDMLSSNGMCYMVVLKENKPEEVMNNVCKLNLHVEILKERKVPCEHLYILKIFK